MKHKFLLTAVLCASTMCSLAARADVNFMPVFDALSASEDAKACYAKAQISSEYRECDYLAYQKLDKLLNLKYAQVIQRCETYALDPKQCKLKLRDMQREWIKLRDSNAEVQPELFYGENGNGIGTLIMFQQFKQLLRQILLLEKALQPK